MARPDVSLDEFEFKIEIEGHSVNLALRENDPIRTMSHEKRAAR